MGELETEKIAQLRNYIIKLEVEKLELSESAKNSKKNDDTRVNNEKIIVEIMNNIEKVKKAQEVEKHNLDSQKEKLLREGELLQEERQKIDAAKKNLKASVQNNMNFFSQQKNKMEHDLCQMKSKIVPSEALNSKIRNLEDSLKKEKEIR